MHFLTTVFLPLNQPFDKDTREADIESLVSDHIGQYCEGDEIEDDAAATYYDWFCIGGRWADTLPTRGGVSDFCNFSDYVPFPRLTKQDKELLKRKYDLYTLPADKITEEARTEAQDLDIVFHSLLPDGVKLMTFDEFVRSQTCTFPYSYVTHDREWYDGDDYDPEFFVKSFKTYVRSLQRHKIKHPRYIGVVNIDCHI